MSRVTIYSSGMCCCSVCADVAVSIEAITEAVNRDNPSGTKNGWSLAKRDFALGDKNPCACNEQKGKLHYLFSC